MLVHGLGDSPGDRAVVGHAYDEPAFARHQRHVVPLDAAFIVHEAAGSGDSRRLASSGAAFAGIAMRRLAEYMDRR
jgi:hypothetical protein